MQKSIVGIFSLLVFIAFISGCTNAGLGVIKNTPAPATLTEATTIPTQTPSLPSVITIPPIVATTVPTVKPPGEPLASPLTLIGKAGNQILWFTIQNPGPVKIDFDYSSTFGSAPICTDEKAYLTLAGPSISIPLSPSENGKISGTKTVNLPMSGRFNLSMRGCFGWKITLSNA
jgi:hypothetical protein